VEVDVAEGRRVEGLTCSLAITIVIVTFWEAFEDSARHSRRHLLLGNGFSIACHPNTFAYGQQHVEADFSNLLHAG